MTGSEFEQAALQIDAEIAKRLLAAAKSLTGEGIPESLTAHTMLRLGAELIRMHCGDKELAISLNELRPIKG